MTPSNAPFRLCAKALRNAAAFLFPPLCIACGESCAAANPWLCGACLSRLIDNHNRREPCPLCGQNRRFAACACEYAWDFPFERICSLFDFDDVVKEMAHAFKYGGLRNLAFFAGKEFGGLVPGDFCEGMDIAVPVPLHVVRAIRRGYNQAERFAAGVCKSWDNRIPLRAHVVGRKRHTRTQTELSRTQRLKNLASAFYVRRPDAVRGKGVVLIDDIVTTGATTGACANVLLDAGARCVRVLSLARD